jgi:uncharacterized integral membrane protein
VGLLTLTRLSAIGIAFAQDQAERVLMLSMNFLLFLGLIIVAGALVGAVFMLIAGVEFLRRRRKVRS